MTVLRTLRKLVLGETWILPLGVAVVVGGGALLRAGSGAGGWWSETGGLVLLLALIVVLAVSLRPPRPREEHSKKVGTRPRSGWRGRFGP